MIDDTSNETNNKASDDASKRILEIHRRLCEAYRCPIAYFHHLDPLSELVSSLLSHRTRNYDSGRAFRELKARFANWHAVMVAPVEEVQDAIAPVTWPEQKAPRIQEALRRVHDRTQGSMSLDFLGDWEVARARKWLEELPGVGPKTSAAVLSFSTLRMPALPVDCHHYRVAIRLALIPKSVPVGRAHDVLASQLPIDWSAQDVYDNHEVLMIHGKRVCFHAEPACQRCVLLDLCPEGQRRMNLKNRATPTTESPTMPMP